MNKRQNEIGKSISNFRLDIMIFCVDADFGFLCIQLPVDAAHSQTDDAHPVMSIYSE